MALDISLRNPGAAFGIQFGSIVTIAGEVIEAQAKQTEAVTGAEAYAGAVAEAQPVQTEAATGTLSITGAVIEDQPQQTEAITGTLPAPAITGAVDEDQPAQTETIGVRIEENYIRAVLENPSYGWVPLEIKKEEPPISAVVSEHTKPQRESIKADQQIFAAVSERIRFTSAITATVGRSRARRDEDLAAILQAIA